MGRVKIQGGAPSSSPLASNSNSSSSRRSSDNRHPAMPSGARNTQLDEESDPENHEYAYAYHTPMENVRLAGSAPTSQLGSTESAVQQGQYQCGIVYPQHNSYAQQPYASSSGSFTLDPHQPRNLRSHLLPMSNGSCPVNHLQTTAIPGEPLSSSQSGARKMSANPFPARQPYDGDGQHEAGWKYGDDGQLDGDSRSARDGGANYAGSSLYSEAHGSYYNGPFKPVGGSHHGQQACEYRG